MNDAGQMGDLRARHMARPESGRMKIDAAMLRQHPARTRAGQGQQGTAVALVDHRGTRHDCDAREILGGVFQPQAGGDKTVKYDQEDTGLGFKTDARLESYVVAQPTSCQMKRPGKS